MATTYKFIAGTTVGAGGVYPLTFSSIPQTYTDLILRLTPRSNISGDVDGARVSINGTDTYPSGFAGRSFTDGSSTASGTGNYNNVFISGAGTGHTDTFGTVEIYFPRYSEATGQKIYLADSSSAKFGAATYVFQGIGFGRNPETGAVTSISIGNFDSGGTSFTQYTTAQLYGIKNS